MAITITNRQVGSHGSLRKETLEFTDDTTSTYAIQTKLGKIIWCHFTSLGTGGANNLEIYVNSASASTTEDDPGVIFVNSGATSSGVYQLYAVGW